MVDRAPAAAPPADRLHRSSTTTLSRWRPPDTEQERLRQQFLDHLSNRRNGWARECRGAHLTASSLVCAPVQRLVLLTLHARLGRWLQTGGHLEADDATIEDAALREAREESGLSPLLLHPEPLLLSRHRLSCSGRPTDHLDVQFLVTAQTAGRPAFGEESLDVRWFAPDDLPETDASVVQLVGAASRRLGWP